MLPACLFLSYAVTKAYSPKVFGAKEICQSQSCFHVYRFWAALNWKESSCDAKQNEFRQGDRATGEWKVKREKSVSEKEQEKEVHYAVAWFKTNSKNISSKFAMDAPKRMWRIRRVDRATGRQSDRTKIGSRFRMLSYLSSCLAEHTFLFLFSSLFPLVFLLPFVTPWIAAK